VVIKKLFDRAVLSARGFKAKMEKRHKTATVVKTPEEMEYTPKMFFERCEQDGDDLILYKSVNPETGCDYRTGKIKYEGVVECPVRAPNAERECGGGLHLNPTSGAALSYHQGGVLRCRVKRKDVVVWKRNISKVRCRRVEVFG